METDRKALAGRLRNGLMKHEDGVLVKVKGEAVCTVRDLRALLATALREEGEPVAWEIQLVDEDGDPAGEGWPQITRHKPANLNNWFRVVPLYRHPHTEDESE